MGVMERYLDQRIINTKQDLYDALFDVLKTSKKPQPLKICEKADVTYTTFHNHYKYVGIVGLITDAIKDQISLRFPIPLKLKPHNLKQFMYYLFHFFADFSLKNKDLIKGSSKYVESKGFKNSYLDLFSKVLGFYINKELKELYSDLQPIVLNMWSETITNGFISLFFNRANNDKLINFEIVKQSMNLFINKYSVLN